MNLFHAHDEADFKHWSWGSITFASNHYYDHCYDCYDDCSDHS